MSVTESLPSVRRLRLPGAEGFVPWLVPLAILLIWQAASVAGLVPVRVLPAPSDVARAGWRLLLSGELAQNIWVSFWRAGIGFLIGGGIGFAFGLANGLSQLSAKLTDTTLQMVRNIPHLALIPLVILWFGIGETSKILLIFLACFAPVALSTRAGVLSASHDQIHAARALGASRAQVLRHVVIPAAMPEILIGLRIGMGVGWTTLVAAEMVAAQAGLGQLVLNASNFLRTDVVVMGILVIGLFATLFELGLRGLERVLVPWKGQS